MLSLLSILHPGRSKTILFDKIKQVVADVEETSTPGFVELKLYHQPILANALSQYVIRYNIYDVRSLSIFLFDLVNQLLSTLVLV